MMTLYARKEHTTCALTLAYKFTQVSPKRRDVVVYRDAEATQPVGRYPWHYMESKPTRRNRYINHNCARYALIWLPDAA